MNSALAVSRRAVAWLPVALLAFTGCGGRGGCTNEYCGTVVFAASGEPTSLLPPVSTMAVERDVFAQICLKLAEIGPDGGTFGDSSFTPELAHRWEWTDPLTLTFHLDPRARWQDGPPVTAADVAFTFDAYRDTLVGSQDRTALGHITSVAANGSVTVGFRFRGLCSDLF